MSTLQPPPLPLPPSRPAFFLGRISLLFVLISVAVHAAAGIWTWGTFPSPQAIGRDLGVFTVGLLISLGVAWAVWRLSRRRRAGAAVFCCLIAFLAVARLAGAVVVKTVADRQREAATRNAQKLEAYQREALQKAEGMASGAKNQPPDEASNFIGKGVDLLRDTAKTAQGSDRQALEVITRVMEDFQGKVRAYESSTGELKAAGYATAVGLDNRGDIARRRVLVKNCTEANEILASSFRNLESTTRTELGRVIDQAQADATARQMAANWNMPVVLGIRDCDRRWLESIDGLLALFDSEFSHWRLNASKKLVFDHPAAFQRHEQLMAQLKGAVQQEDMLKQQEAARLKRLHGPVPPSAASPSPTPVASR